jgi:hypothetical protein
MHHFPAFKKKNVSLVLLAFLTAATFSAPSHAEDVASDTEIKPSEPAGKPAEAEKDQGWWDGLKGRVSKYSGDSLGSTAEEELRKVNQFLYKVLEIPIDDTPVELEKKLNTLGKEGWECFDSFTVNPSAEIKATTTAPNNSESTKTTAKKIRVICKKRPLSYLRMLGRGW